VRGLAGTDPPRTGVADSQRRGARVIQIVVAELAELADPANHSVKTVALGAID
jgi:hypothetical protein